VLPKSTAISTYSYRLSQKTVNSFMRAFAEKQKHAENVRLGYHNLDFHTIQHYGEQSVLEEHYAGARSKRVKGALTFIAQDCDSRCQLYVQTDIARSEADDQILRFVEYWKKIRGSFVKPWYLIPSLPRTKILPHSTPMASLYNLTTTRQKPC